MQLFYELGKVSAFLETSTALPCLCPSPCDLHVSLCSKAQGEGGGEAPAPAPSSLQQLQRSMANLGMGWTNTGCLQGLAGTYCL